MRGCSGLDCPAAPICAGLWPERGNVSDYPVTIETLQRFAERFGDLADPEVMRQAWE